ncbi:SDR family oxidoreductase [Flexivirga oryzae]
MHHHAMYAESKAAIPAMVRNLAPELAEGNITINAIAPSATAIRVAAYAPNYIHPALVDVPFESLMHSMSAFGRLGQPHEIAVVVAFLVSPDTSFITGITMAAAGADAHRRCEQRERS